MDSKPYPIDFDAYGRGDIVPAHILEEASGHTKGSDKYRFWCLAVIQNWKKRLYHAGQGFVSIGMKGDTIKVMDDGQEQLDYCRKGKGKSRQEFLNRHLEQGSVDLTLLSIEEADRTRREMERDGKLLMFDRPNRKLPSLKIDET